MPQGAFDPACAITMLFTDVVDSSGIKRHPSLGKTSEDRDRVYLETIQSPHFVLIRECLSDFGGQEVSTMGDSFFVTFRDAEAALRCAVDIQKRMYQQPIATPSGPLRVRIGLHSGNPKFFDGSWHGTDVDVGARIEAVGTGGQILISSVTRELVKGVTGLPFHRLGKFILRGSAAVELWEADWDGTGPRRTSVLTVAAQQRRNLIRAGVALTAAVALLSAGYWVWQTRATAGLPVFGTVPARRTVAVMGFENLSGKPDVGWLSTALVETLNSELAAGGKLRISSSDDVARTKIDLALPNSSSYPAKALKQIQDNLGVDSVISGAYLDLGGGSGQVRMDLRVQDTRTRETVFSVSQSGSEAGVADLVSTAVTEVRQRLGAGPVSDSKLATIALPSGSDATRLYAAGLGKLRAFDAAGARDLLLKAVSTDPKFPLAHAALSTAWLQLGDDEKAKQEAKTAFELSANFPQQDRLELEGQYHEASKEWNEAIDAYGKLLGLYPDRLDYGLRRVALQIAAGRGKDARATVSSMYKLRAGLNDGARIDLAAAKADDAVADYRGERTAAGRALEKGRTLGARLIEAEAALTLGLADLRLSDLANAALHLELAKTLFQAVGDAGGVARAAAALVDLQHRKGVQ